MPLSGQSVIARPNFKNPLLVLSLSQLQLQNLIGKGYLNYF